MIAKNINLMILLQLTASKKHRLKTRGDVSDANCRLCGGDFVFYRLVLFTDWPSCSFSEAPVFFIFFGVFMKSGKMVRKPRMSTNLWQLSVPSGPIIPWSRTFRALVRDNFFSLQQRQETMLQPISLNTAVHFCFLWELNTLPLQLDWIVGFFKWL